MSFILNSQKKNPHLKCTGVTNSELSRYLQLTFKWDSAEEKEKTHKICVNMRKQM